MNCIVNETKKYPTIFEFLEANNLFLELSFKGNGYLKACLKNEGSRVFGETVEGHFPIEIVSDSPLSGELAQCQATLSFLINYLTNSIHNADYLSVIDENGNPANILTPSGFRPCGADYLIRLTPQLIK